MDTVQKGEELVEALRLMDGEVTVPFIVVESLLERHEQEKIRMRKEHEKTIKRMSNVVRGTRIVACIIVLSVLFGVMFVCSTYSFKTVDVEQHTTDGGSNTFVGGDSYGNPKNQDNGSKKQEK